MTGRERKRRTGRQDEIPSSTQPLVPQRAAGDTLGDLTTTGKFEFAATSNIYENLTFSAIVFEESFIVNQQEPFHQIVFTIFQHLLMNLQSL